MNVLKSESHNVAIDLVQRTNNLARDRAQWYSRLEENIVLFSTIMNAITAGSIWAALKSDKPEPAAYIGGIITLLTTIVNIYRKQFLLEKIKKAKTFQKITSKDLVKLASQNEFNQSEFIFQIIEYKDQLSFFYIPQKYAETRDIIKNFGLEQLEKLQAERELTIDFLKNKTRNKA